MAQRYGPTLREGLESLPQELYDIIFDYTFTPPSRNGVVTVDAKFNGSAVSNVSRATNALLLKRYNTCTIVGSIWHILYRLESFRGRDDLKDVRCWFYASDEEMKASGGCIPQHYTISNSLWERLQSELGMREFVRFRMTKEKVS